MTTPDLFTAAPPENKPKFDLKAYILERNEVLKKLFPDDKDLFEVKK